MRKIRSVLSHCNIILAGVFLTLVVINEFNPAMLFLTGRVTNVFLILFCLSSLALGVFTIMENRQHDAYLREREIVSIRARHQGTAPVRPPEK